MRILDICRDLFRTYIHRLRIDRTPFDWHTPLTPFFCVSEGRAIREAIGHWKRVAEKRRGSLTSADILGIDLHGFNNVCLQ